MKKLYVLLSLLLLFTPFVSKAGCDNKVTVAVGGIGVRSKPGSTNGATFEYCPTGSNTVIVDGATSTANAVLSWTKTVNGVTSPVASTSTTDFSGTYSTLSVSPDANTVYTLTSDISRVCNGNNAVSSQSITISPTLEVTASSSLVCSGALTTLTATGSSNGQYTWSGPGIATTTNAGILVVYPTVTTTYTVTTNTTSCGTTTQQITITVKSVTIAPSAPNVCSGQSITLVASYDGISVISYKWENVTAGTTLPSTTSSQTVTPTATTTYKVTATTSDCSTVTQQVTATVGTAPTVAVFPTAATICSGATTTLTAASNNAGTTYKWVDLATPGTVISTSSTCTTPALTTSETYRLTATSCNGSGSSPSVITHDVTVTVAPLNYTVTPSSAICSGSSITMLASSNISGATCKWYVAPFTSTSPVVNISPTLTVSPTANTTYRVVITTACGTSNTASAPDVVITVNPKPTVGVTPATTSKTRYAAATLTATGGNTYTWTATANGVTTTLAANTATITVYPQYNTVYTVTGSTTATGCTNSAQAAVNISGPLPVELTSFEVFWVNKAASITWATASEKNSAYFEVERSFDGTTFQSVGKRAGAGTTAVRTNYQLTDVSLNNVTGTVYYRLRQVDVSGEETYSPVRALQVVKAGNTFQAVAFPNPYTSTAAVRFHSSGNDAIKLTLCNVLGQNIFTKFMTTEEGVQEIDLPLASSLPLDVYFLTIRQGNQQQVVRIYHQ